MGTQTLKELSKAVGVELKVRDSQELIAETFEHLADRRERKKKATRNRPEGVVADKTLTPEEQRARMGKLD